jgi:hypothetical protein
MGHRTNENGVLRSLKEAHSKELIRFSNLQRLLNLRTAFACNVHECLRGTSTLIAGLTELQISDGIFTCIQGVYNDMP